MNKEETIEKIDANAFNTADGEYVITVKDAIEIIKGNFFKSIHPIICTCPKHLIPELLTYTR